MHRNQACSARARDRRVSMATHRPSLNASGSPTIVGSPKPAGFNGHSSAIPQCISWPNTPCTAPAKVSMATHRPSLNASLPSGRRSAGNNRPFQWPLIGHPSMHRLVDLKAVTAALSFNGHSSAIPQCICKEAYTVQEQAYVSMATHRPSLNASLSWPNTPCTAPAKVSMATHRPSLNAS